MFFSLFLFLTVNTTSSIIEEVVHLSLNLDYEKTSRNKLFDQSQHRIYARIVNKSDYVYAYHDFNFRLFMYKNGSWDVLNPVITGFFPILIPPLYIYPGETESVSFLLDIYGHLSSGEYKIEIEVLRKDQTEAKNLYLTITF